MSADRLGNTTTNTQLSINSNTTINIKGNDFSYVGAKGVIAVGDVSTPRSIFPQITGARPSPRPSLA